MEKVQWVTIISGPEIKSPDCNILRNLTQNLTRLPRFCVPWATVLLLAFSWQYLPEAQNQEEFQVLLFVFEH